MTMRRYMTIVENAGPTYPLAPTGEWYGDADYESRGGRIVWMSPDDYLGRVRPLVIDDTTRENIDELKAHIQAGRTLDPLAIYADGREDGRHRARAAKEMGIPKVPVIVFDRLTESAGETVTLLDLYDPSELSDPREMLSQHAAPVDWEKPLVVHTMTPEQARTYRAWASDETVLGRFQKHAKKAQRALVRDKATNYDESRIIVVCHDAVLDGNHHLVAAIRANRPVRYVDLAEID